MKLLRTRSLPSRRSTRCRLPSSASRAKRGWLRFHSASGRVQVGLPAGGSAYQAHAPDPVRVVQRVCEQGQPAHAVPDRVDPWRRVAHPQRVVGALVHLSHAEPRLAGRQTRSNSGMLGACHRSFGGRLRPGRPRFSSVSTARCGGWTFEPAFANTELGADYWIIKVGDRSIGGLQRSASDARPHAGTRLYVEVTDLEAVLSEVQIRGGQVERSRTALGGADRWFATALDPTGVSFGMWTASAPG
jgi:predicted enzyme related to lactoylglutathione lyase